MKTIGRRKKTYDTYYKARLALFAGSYVGYAVQNYIRNKYKISDDLSKHQLHQQFSNKKTIPEISRLSKVLNVNYQLLLELMVLNKKPRLDSRIEVDRRVRVYLKLENEMIFLSTERLDKVNMINEDYERAILSPAIERVAGNDLRNINNDFVFNQRHMNLRREYTRLYYKVAHRYKLLTPGNRALILRLITK